jgi:hypothetical protein
MQKCVGEVNGSVEARERDSQASSGVHPTVHMCSSATCWIFEGQGRQHLIQRKTCKQSRLGKRENNYIRLASLTEGYVRPVRPSLPESVLGLYLILRCVFVYLRIPTVRRLSE